MIEKNDLYDYGFYIFQNREYFKFSIDSILLAEFIRFKRNDRILDMCTGNAPIPLILTSKDDNLKIDAVEIQKEVYDLAKKSIEINNLHNINIINDDVKNVKLKSKYDIIVCNPPYFKVNENSILNENEVKKIARHEIQLNLKDVIMTASKHIKETGKFYMVHRNERLIDAINLLEENSFGIRKICFVFTKEYATSEFFLIEAVKHQKSDPKIAYLNIKNFKTYKGIFEEVFK